MTAPLTNREIVRQFLKTNPGYHTRDQIALATGLDPNKVSTATGHMTESGEVVHVKIENPKQGKNNRAQVMAFKLCEIPGAAVTRKELSASRIPSTVGPRGPQKSGAAAARPEGKLVPIATPEPADTRDNEIEALMTAVRRLKVASCGSNLVSVDTAVEKITSIRRLVVRMENELLEIRAAFGHGECTHDALLEKIRAKSSGVAAPLSYAVLKSTGPRFKNIQEAREHAEDESLEHGVVELVAVIDVCSARPVWGKS